MIVKKVTHGFVDMGIVKRRFVESVGEVLGGIYVQDLGSTLKVEKGNIRINLHLNQRKKRIGPSIKGEFVDLTIEFDGPRRIYLKIWNKYYLKMLRCLG